MFSEEALDRMAKAIVREEAKTGRIKDLPPEASTTWGDMAWTQEDLMEHVPDDLNDKECDKRYNPMAKKATAGSRKKGSVVPPSVGNTHWHD